MSVNDVETTLEKLSTAQKISLLAGLVRLGPSTNGLSKLTRHRRGHPLRVELLAYMSC